MADYRLRPATLDDADALVHHRIAMFTEMGVPLDAPALDAVFRPWLAEMMPKGVYRAWVVERDDAGVVSGGGITILHWPPGPRYLNDRLAFVYNVYTEPDHRHRGLARMVMDAIHAWCRADGIRSIALNASRFGQPLYEAMGYTVTTNPMMFLALE
jgi:GNAT superfamily N-acetyltransferase